MKLWDWSVWEIHVFLHNGSGTRRFVLNLGSSFGPLVRISKTATTNWGDVFGQSVLTFAGGSAAWLQYLNVAKYGKGRLPTQGQRDAIMPFLTSTLNTIVCTTHASAKASNWLQGEYCEHLEATIPPSDQITR
jgi:hypothetical protein